MFYIYLLLFSVVFFSLSFYASKSVKTLTNWKSSTYIFVGMAFLSFVFALLMYVLRRKAVWTLLQQSAMGTLLSWLIFILIICLVLFLEDFVRFFIFLKNKIVKNGKKSPKRSKKVSFLALFLAFLPILAIIYGVTEGKYHYKVKKYTIFYEDLPNSFDGYTITQLSDIHSGSLKNIEKVEKGIALANAQNSDVILLTGDIVNNLASELPPLMPTLKKLKAKDGVFSVLGNHDYGDYSTWETSELKAQNFQQILDYQKDMGFKVLLNQTHFIERNGEKIALIGVENWGAGRFSKYGNLEKAMQNVDNQAFKILMSHDPTHWENIVIPQQKNIQLTLSGHTHGMQFGIEIDGIIKWSPSKWTYQRWAGLYEEAGKYLNVNRGFGFHAFPGRIGIWPEITVIELRKKR